MVDIIQAVGRVIRKAAGKPLGTIVIPVLIDESEDADHILSQSAFEPVWQVLKALRAHDRRLDDELDQLRLSLGRGSKSASVIRHHSCKVERLILNHCNYNSWQEGTNGPTRLPKYSATTARSYHTGMVMVSMLDGSSRGINDKIGLSVWRALSTRSGSEVVAAF